MINSRGAFSVIPRDEIEPISFEVHSRIYYWASSHNYICNEQEAFDNVTGNPRLIYCSISTTWKLKVQWYRNWYPIVSKSLYASEPPTKPYKSPSIDDLLIYKQLFIISNWCEVKSIQAMAGQAPTGERSPKPSYFILDWKAQVWSKPFVSKLTGSWSSVFSGLLFFLLQAWITQKKEEELMRCPDCMGPAP